jgi:hypothetical protein
VSHWRAALRNHQGAPGFVDGRECQLKYAGTIAGIPGLSSSPAHALEAPEHHPVGGAVD